MGPVTTWAAVASIMTTGTTLCAGTTVLTAVLTAGTTRASTLRSIVVLAFTVAAEGLLGRATPLSAVRASLAIRPVVVVFAVSEHCVEKMGWGGVSGLDVCVRLIVCSKRCK